jgi:hypothetical protein
MERNKAIFRSGLAALVAVFAMSVVAAGSASAALPEFLNKEGKLPTLKGFTVAGVGEPSFEFGGNGLPCKTASGREAKITGSKTVSEKMVFTGCTFKLGNSNCQSEGQVAGTIVTNLLKGTLAYYNKGYAGMYFEPAEGTSKTWAKFECGEKTFKLSGCLVASVSPLNTLTGVEGKHPSLEETADKLTAEVETEGKTIKCKLELAGTQAAMTASWAWTPEESLEVKA